MAGESDDETAARTIPSARSRTAPTSPPPDRYRMLDLIGEGGMGRVYRAHDTTLGRDVAVKVIETSGLHGPDRTRQREWFVREARAAARILHPNIAVVHDVDPDAGWLVMELVEGESLAERCAKGPLALDAVAKIAAQVLGALAAAHEAGVIHRDIKPSNIMLTAGDQVKVVDFGVARLSDADMTLTVDKVGTPAYMAPEQARGASVDGRADLYTLGATLYEVITRDRVNGFESLGPEELAKLEQACATHPTLGAVITRCLQGSRSARYPTARDALAALEGKAPPAAPEKSRLVWILAAVAAIGIGTVAGVMAGRKSPPPVRDRRVAQAFALAQRGENEKALQVLADYLVKNRDDPDANTIAFLAKWWQGSQLDEAKKKLVDLQLLPAQRAMVNGVELITQRRDPEAIAYLEQADRETPNSVEILYALGEAQWHGGHLDDGVVTLERSFAIDPRWEMALHHVLEYRLSRGESAKLAPVSDRLRTTDPAAAAALDCKLAVSDRDYPRAVKSATASLASTSFEKIPELYLCLAQAQALAGDIPSASATAKTAFDLWPLEAKDKGGFAQYAELFLYRNDLDGYLELTRGRRSSQRAIAILVRRPALPVDEPQPEWPKSRMAPLGAATWILQQHVHGIDASGVYTTYPEPEIRAWGAALAAEAKGDRATAIARLRDALTVPAKGDVRMLVAHRLAKLLHESGDAAGAKAACDDVIRPRFYVNYRAVLLPDCTAWSAAP